MCLACKTKVTAESLEEFAARYLELLNHGALCLMISIGHRTGLFQTLRSAGPCTSAQLAKMSHLNERYVRECLGAITAGKIVEIEDDHFVLPETVCQLFANEEETSNIAYLSQYIGMLGEVETRVVECFSKGGGVPYSAYPRFHDVMAQDSGQNIVAALPDHILPLVPGLTVALQNGISVLDIGCGRGRALQFLAEKFPCSRFTGFDLSERRSPMRAITRIVQGWEICGLKSAISPSFIAKRRRPPTISLRLLTRFMIKRGRTMS